MTPFRLAAATLTVALPLLGACSGESIRRQEREVRVEKLHQEIANEVSVGRAVTAKLFGQFKPHEDPALEAYVQLVGQSIALRSGRPELQFRFGLLASDELNAFAAPGGYILLTRGLIRELKSEDELAVVLSHEIAHINEKHLYTAVLPKREVGATETLARILSRGSGDLGQSLTAIVSSGIAILTTTGFPPEHEYVADQNGALYAMAAGYDPYALAALLERLRAKGAIGGVSKTHPPADKRLSGLKGFLKSNGFTDKGGVPPKNRQQRFLLATQGLNR